MGFSHQLKENFFLILVNQNPCCYMRHTKKKKSESEWLRMKLQMKIYQSIENKKKVKDMISISEKNFQTPLVQWLRIHLPMQGTWVQSLVQGDATSWGWGELSPCTSTTEPEALELVLGNKRSHSNEKPIHRDQRVAPYSP